MKQTDKIYFQVEKLHNKRFEMDGFDVQVSCGRVLSLVLEECLCVNRDVWLCFEVLKKNINYLLCI